MGKLILNAGIFQLGWILSVLFGNVVAMASALVSSVIYYGFFVTGRRDLTLIVGVVLLGFIGDTLMGILGVLVHANGWPFPPPWMVTLWLLFAMTLPWSLRALAARKPLFLMLCVIGGTLSYSVGERLSDVSFGYPRDATLLILGGAWLIYGVLILLLINRWNQSEQ